MLQLVYVSSATILFTDQQLADLLSVARRNNERRDITGMLLYHDGNFMQVLEGPEGHVREVHLAIERDPRHHGIIVILKRHIAERQFADWSMGFRNLDSVELRDLPGYSEFMNTPLVGEAYTRDPTRGIRLLLTFKETSLR